MADINRGIRKMTEQEREELIEKMAKAAWESDGAGCRWEIVVQESVRNEWLREARAALAVAEPAIREQCAEMAENYGYDVSASKYASSVGAMCACGAAKDIAAAIREGGKSE